jgi:hypothetical protein
VAEDSVVAGVVCSRGGDSGGVQCVGAEGVGKQIAVGGNEGDAIGPYGLRVGGVCGKGDERAAHDVAEVCGAEMKRTLIRSFLVLWLLGFWTFEALAQPQAPIVWDPIEVLYNGEGNQNQYPNDVVCRGDTLVLVSRFARTMEQCSTGVRISSDNGQTWGPWTTLDSIRTNPHPSYTTTALTESAIYCFSQHDWVTGCFWTTDLGSTWHVPTVGRDFLYEYRHGDTLFGYGWPDSLTWTADRGLE